MYVCICVSNSRSAVGSVARGAEELKMMYVYMCVCLGMFAFRIHAFMSVCTYARMYVHMYLHTCVHTHVLIDAYMHM